MLFWKDTSKTKQHRKIGNIGMDKDTPDKCKQKSRRGGKEMSRLECIKWVKEGIFVL